MDRITIFESDPMIFDTAGNVIINPDLLVYSHIKKLIVRSKPIKGDSSGANKLYAEKELLCIYHLVHYKSPCAKITMNKDKAKMAQKLSGVDKMYLVYKGMSNQPRVNPEIYNWAADDIFIAARNQYEEIVYSNPMQLFVTEIKQSIYVGNSMVSHLNTRMSERLNQSKEDVTNFHINKEGTLKHDTKVFKSKLAEFKAKEQLDIAFMFETFKSIQEVVKQLPDMLDRIEKVGDTVSGIEENTAKVIKVIGNKTVPQRANAQSHQAKLKALNAKREEEQDAKDAQDEINKEERNSSGE